jgi:hypothetical protein
MAALANIDIDEAIWARLTAPDDGTPAEGAADVDARAARRQRRRRRREAVSAAVIGGGAAPLSESPAAAAAASGLPPPPTERPTLAPLVRADSSEPEFWEAQGSAKASARAPASAAALGGGGGGAQLFDVWQQRLSNAVFLLLGVGVSIAWTALRSGIVYYCTHFSLGSAFFTVLTVAYNVPALPVLLLQMAADDGVDARVGQANALLCRFATTLLAMAGGCLLLAFVRTQALVLGVTVLTGVMNAAAFGTSLKYFSIFPPACGGYYFMGASLSSLATIALTFATGFQSPEPSAATFAAFYSGASVLIFAGLVAVVALMRAPIGAHYMELSEARSAAARAAKAAARSLQMRALPGGDGDAKRGGAAVPLLLDSVDGGGDGVVNAVAAAAPRASVLGRFDEDGGGDSTAGDSDGDGAPAAAAAAAPAAGVAVILRATALCHVALFLCWACTTAVDGLLDVVPTASAGASAQRTFRLLLLYASLLGELSGKQLNVVRVGGWGVAKTPAALLAAVAARAVAALAFLLYIMQPRLTASGGYALRTDAGAVAFQAAFDCAGAYLSSVAYTIASKQLPAQTLRAQSAVMLGVTVTVGVYAGLGTSYAVANIARTFSGGDDNR